MSRTSRLALALVSLAALGACQSRKQLAYSNDEHLQLSAQETTQELKLQPAIAGERLADEERSAVRAFAAAYRAEGHGAIVISRPSNGTNDEQAVRAAADARAVMLSEGVSATLIAEGPYDAGGAASAPLLLSFRTWQAVAPNCSDISRYDMAWTGTNQALPSLGCAMAQNLAAMIANPEDLVRATPMDPTDGQRQATILSKYRNGEPTGAQHSDDARGTISDAVKD